MPNQRSADFSTLTRSSPAASRSPTMVGSRHSAFTDCPASLRRKSWKYVSNASKTEGAKPQKFMDTTVSPSSTAPVSSSRMTPSCSRAIFSVSRMSLRYPSFTWHTPRDTVPWAVTVFFSR